MTEEQVTAWLGEVFECRAEELTADRSRDDIPAWDSLGVLTLMAGFDEKFGLVMSADDMQKLQRVGDVLALLRSRGKLD